MHRFYFYKHATLEVGVSAAVGPKLKAGSARWVNSEELDDTRFSFTVFQTVPSDLRTVTKMPSTERTQGGPKHTQGAPLFSR